MKNLGFRRKTYKNRKSSKFVVGNYSIAGKRGQWPAPEDTSLPYLTLPYFVVVAQFTTDHIDKLM